MFPANEQNFQIRKLPTGNPLLKENSCAIKLNLFHQIPIS